VLVDADNVGPSRLQPVLTVLGEVSGELEVIASGRPEALARVTWPATATVLASTGWQRADLALAQAYRPTAEPLILVSGDGDFGLLTSRHPGPVLVISGAASGRLRDGTTVVDPATEGVQPVRAWLRANQVELSART
jgi:hypothetical protein